MKTMPRRGNRAGVYGGWFQFRNRNLERWLYIMHRVTGVGVGIYFVIHVWETSFSATSFLGVQGGGSPIAWSDLMSFLSSQLFHTGLLFVVLASVFHALNGLRLLLVEQGFLIGRVKLPSFPPVPSSLNALQRYLGVVFVALSFVLTSYAFYELFVVGLGWRI